MLAVASLALHACALHSPPDRGIERVFYLVDRPASLESFARNSAQVSVLAPQSFSIDAEGAVTGTIPADALRLARERGVRVMPLIVNPDWSREIIHAVLIADAARKRLIDRLVEIGQREQLWGWQLDFENIDPADRDLLTQLVREASSALHAHDLMLSIAVEADQGVPGGSAFDVAALAEICDFISIMTYDQHSATTPPGPVGGLPWVERSVANLLSQGVPPKKISLGVPFYSMYWHAIHDGETYRSTAQGLDHDGARELLARFNATLRWDDEQKTHYARWENHGLLEHLYVEDVRSFEAKRALIRKYGLRGFSAWRLGHEDPRVWRSL